MKTYLDCIPCFFKQALEAARISGANSEVQKAILDEVAQAIPGFPLEASPPVMARTIHNLVKYYVSAADPYQRIKDESNQLALQNYNKIKDKIRQSSDPLLAAVEMAIAGNIIDYGVKNRLNVDVELEKILSSGQPNNRNVNGTFFQIKLFKKVLKEAESILYLADNAGETVFDRALIEEIRRLYANKEILYAVKDKPIINDALEKDAVDCGIGPIATIISSGSDAPGTILDYCSEHFLEKYYKADMVISKGQGNFEGLSEAGRSIFFLLIAKCSVIAKDIGCQVGEAVLFNNRTVQEGIEKRENL